MNFMRELISSVDTHINNASDHSPFVTVSVGSVLGWMGAITSWLTSYNQIMTAACVTFATISGGCAAIIGLKKVKCMFSKNKNKDCQSE